MAGTPTQYYSLPTYADSDAVDLTAQYNQAMSVIDSTMHTMQVASSDAERHLLILGDSWTYRPYGPQLERAMGQLGWTVHNYGVGGARIDETATSNNIIGQARKATAELERVDAVLIIALVNDISTNTSAAHLVGGMNDTTALLSKAFNKCPITWLPNVSADAESNPIVASYVNQYLVNPLTYNVTVNLNLMKYMLFSSNAFDSGKRHPSTAIDFGCLVVGCLNGMAQVASISLGDKRDGNSLYTRGDNLYLIAMTDKTVDLTTADNRNALTALYTFGNNITNYEVGDCTIAYTGWEQLIIAGATPAHFTAFHLI